MANLLADIEAQKKAAAQRALEMVTPDTLVGLGTGSTARYFIEGLGTRVRDGFRVQAVVTSQQSRQLAESLEIPIVDHLDRLPDLAVDGADEIDPDINCIKGRGGALLREKIVAHASRRFVLIADESKLVPHLGRAPVPVEVLPFLWEVTARAVESLRGRSELRVMNGKPFISDNGNLILDTTFERVDRELASALQAIPGVLAHGLFFAVAREAIIGSSAGVRLLGPRTGAV
jgi:ribose 5-phosphate isomerase A